MSKTEDFLYGVREYVRYWDSQDRDSKGKLEGLAFSLLVMLDGGSGMFHGDIGTLYRAVNKENISLHENFYKKENNER